MTSPASNSVTSLFAAKSTGNAKPLGEPLDKARRPWENEPYLLISWWNMERFSVEPLYLSACVIGQMQIALKGFRIDSKNKGETDFIPSDIKKRMRTFLLEIRKQLKQLEMEVGEECAREMLLKMRQEFVTFDELEGSLSELDNTIRREMETVLFFHVPSNRRDFYKQETLFGPRVEETFPRASYEIRQAGNCYTFECPTACVFHLMRVMEIGVQAFGEMLKIDFAESKEWGKILCIVTGKIEAETKVRPRGAHDLEIIAWNQIHAHLNSVKTGWRNPTMHPNDRCDMKQAKELLGLVETFMKSLAKRVKPGKTGPEPA